MKRNKWKYLLGLLLSLIMVMGFVALCYAATEGAGPVPAPEGKPPAFGNLYVIGWSAVNFFLLLSVLYKFAYNPIGDMLEKRTTTIESSIKHAEELKVEVEQMRKEAQANLIESRKEAQEIVARSTKSAEEAHNELIAKGKEEYAAIVAKGTTDILAQTEQAKVELRDTAAALAMMAAEKILGRAITEADHQKMVKEFVNEAGDLLC
ncbi:MAG: F0F1 ATP synthase subunit B [Firmicutes bacterium]|nr:F0F1 ATP synthase subunit B [Bacillota bacterium]